MKRYGHEKQLKTCPAPGAGTRGTWSGCLRSALSSSRWGGGGVGRRRGGGERGRGRKGGGWRRRESLAGGEGGADDVCVCVAAGVPVQRGEAVGQGGRPGLLHLALHHLVGHTHPRRPHPGMCVCVTLLHLALHHLVGHTRPRRPHPGVCAGRGGGGGGGGAFVRACVRACACACACVGGLRLCGCTLAIVCVRVPIALFPPLHRNPPWLPATPLLPPNMLPHPGNPPPP